MKDPLETPPNWPRLAISIDAAAGTVTLAGTTTPVAGASLDDTRLHALEIALAHAARIRRPLYAHARDPAGSWLLTVHPDGEVHDHHRSAGRPVLPLMLAVLLTVMCLAAAGVGAVAGVR